MSTPTPRALIIVNDIESGPRRIIQWLIDEKIDFDVRIGENRTLPAADALGAYDGLILLGGGYMPDDYQGAPWLEAEADLARTALEDTLPTLGICLGGQLLAQVGGGEVRAAHGTPEKGSTPINLNRDAGQDPIFADVSPNARFIESHIDQITELPAAAVLLASSDGVTNQAFRLGENAWGLQFHPEAGAENVEKWDPEKLAGLGFDKDTLVAEARAAQPQADADGRALLHGFAARIRQRAQARTSTDEPPQTTA